jgi:hypothetical protein
MVAARLATMSHGGDRKSDQGANLRLEVSQDQACRMLNISERLLQYAKVVQDEGTPELVAAVDQGYLAVSKKRPLQSQNSAFLTQSDHRTAPKPSPQSQDGLLLALRNHYEAPKTAVPKMKQGVSSASRSAYHGS